MFGVLLFSPYYTWVVAPKPKFVACGLCVASVFFFSLFWLGLRKAIIQRGSLKSWRKKSRADELYFFSEWVRVSMAATMCVAFLLSLPRWSFFYSLSLFLSLLLSLAQILYHKCQRNFASRYCKRVNERMIDEHNWWLKFSLLYSFLLINHVNQTASICSLFDVFLFSTVSIRFALFFFFFYFFHPAMTACARTSAFFETVWIDGKLRV